ncbi:MAG: DinB family protein [Bacteroidota bacterium]
MTSLLQRPTTQASSSYFKRYIDQVEGNDILKALLEQKANTLQFAQDLPGDKWEWAYAPNKWTIKEVMIHLIDTERVFAYRALRFARHDQTPLPGFEQDDYVIGARASQRSVASVLREYQAVRAASLALFESLDEAAMLNIGTASNSPFSPLALAYVIAGHELHHMKIIQERYLV